MNHKIKIKRFFVTFSFYLILCRIISGIIHEILIKPSEKAASYLLFPSSKILKMYEIL